MEVIIDYLTLTTKIFCIDDFIKELGLSDVTFLELPGRYGWLYRRYYMGCSFLYGGRDDICIELSGTGCRTVEEFNESFDWFSFLQQFEQDLRFGDVNVSRLDIAGDDRSGKLVHRKMVKHCLDRRYVCKARYRIWIDGDEQQIYFGSPASDRRLRIYNKALEQGIDGKWTRCEMQMRNKNALSFLLHWFRIGSIGEAYAEVLLDFLRFTDTVPDGSHYDRIDICNWWIDFIGGIEKCAQLYIAPPNYSLMSVRKFLEKSSASSIKLLLTANNGDWQDIIDIVERARLNSRQLQLLDKIQKHRLL